MLCAANALVGVSVQRSGNRTPGGCRDGWQGVALVFSIRQVLISKLEQQYGS